MHKLSEKILEKQLTKVIGEITTKICNENFEATFKEVCEGGLLRNNTTIATTYELLEEMAIKEVNKIFNAQIDDIDYLVWKLANDNKNNPFADCLALIWSEFIDYILVREIVETFIGDELAEKQQQLYDCGIVDKEGDYTLKNSGEQKRNYEHNNDN